MAMNYTSLVADKNTTGSIKAWVNYARLDADTVVEEAQALIYQALRVREMRTQAIFRMAAAASFTDLPARFLDPIGRIYCPTLNLSFRHKDENFLLLNRNFETTTGTFGTNPFSTTADSTKVTVNLPGHGFNQGGTLTIAGSSAVGGITPNGTFEIIEATDSNNFVIDTLTMTATGTAAGGTAATYACDSLVAAYPNWWSIWSERIYFDAAFLAATDCTLQYFQSLPLLSVSNLTNFLTNRYPQLMRTACVTAAADFMKDDGEYQKGMTRLGSLIGGINAESDLMYRGVEIDTETP